LFVSVRQLAQTLGDVSKVEVSVLALRDGHTDSDLASWHPIVPQVCDAHGPRAFGYSPALRRRLEQISPDLAHVHGLWMYPSLACLNWHRRSGRPFLISPRGMLDSWALATSRWKKNLAGWLYEKSHLRSASCLHALCESEARAIRAYGLENPICVIPNGIDLPELRTVECGVRNSLWGNGVVQAGAKVLLYLGRIHPKKGLVNLLRAWAAIQRTEDGGRRREEWVLAIAGWDQGGHEKELRVLSAECGIEKSVVFLGPQFGEDKAACYRACDGFILPSFSEGLPMVVLEAWASAKPVLMTPECNLPEGFAAEAALSVKPSPQSIKEGLIRFFQMNDASRQAMGQRGRALVAERFTWPKVAQEMQAVYEWVLGKGPKPDCVHLP
jgi:poly(glycerol-phosphate) alpha-glucosyltransferase